MKVPLPAEAMAARGRIWQLCTHGGAGLHGVPRRWLHCRDRGYPCGGRIFDPRQLQPGPGQRARAGQRRAQPVGMGGQDQHPRDGVARLRQRRAPGHGQTDDAAADYRHASRHDDSSPFAGMIRIRFAGWHIASQPLQAPR